MSRGTIIFLTSVWAPGYGVSVVVREQCRILSAAGWNPVVGAIRVEPGLDHAVDVMRLPFLPVLLRARLESLAPYLVIACTSPFPQALAGWGVPWIQWDHGRADQPEGVLHMETSAAERVGPSRWLASRFDPSGIAIPNGGDHLGREAPKSRPGEPIRVVAALRAGAAEALYKGNAFLERLPAQTGRSDFRWELMLRGGDPTGFERAGWTVHNNPDRAAMASLWCSADIHLAPSRIESFDLPLAEAQHLGCAGIALEGGGHAEICPTIFPHDAALTAFLTSLDREGVDRLRECSFKHIAPYSWESHGKALVGLVERASRPWTGRVPRAFAARIIHAAAATAYDLARRIVR